MIINLQTIHKNEISGKFLLTLDQETTKAECGEFKQFSYEDT